MRGRRVPVDTDIHELEPGDYFWDGGPVLYGRTPDGEIARVDARWRITEDEQDRVTVGPLNQGEANSIWVNKDGTPPGWHGYLKHGVWETV